jgi:phospholipid-binding lipoprotein MlaA
MQIQKGFLLPSIMACLLAIPVMAQEYDNQEVAEEKIKEVDPWEGFNRAIFKFNDAIDRWCLKPVAKGYRFVTPDLLERGVSNVFSNIGEVPSTLNGVLQGNVKGAAHDTGRFLVNSTLGIAGIFDVAKHMKLPADDKEDFGQTLAVWGVGEGNYLVLPFLGPSTVRDGFAKPVDWYTDPTTYIKHEPTRWQVRGVSIIDLRASLLSLEENITGDKYTFIRDVYLDRRNYLINNGEVEDEFGGDSEEFEGDL